MKIISNRKKIQIGFSVIVLFLIIYFKIQIFWIFIFGSVLGIFLGKIFCRWMCPMGLLMEALIRRNPDKKKAMELQYYKFGCPISWISGFLNKFSLFKIKKDPDICAQCGKCDEACYVSSYNSEYSLYLEKKKNSSEAQSCARCFECVEACPAKSLQVKR
ncbi:MAG: 4Fe-4S binding protein [Myxococcota bacterium]